MLPFLGFRVMVEASTPATLAGERSGVEALESGDLKLLQRRLIELAVGIRPR